MVRPAKDWDLCTVSLLVGVTGSLLPDTREGVRPKPSDLFPCLTSNLCSCRLCRFADGELQIFSTGLAFRFLLLKGSERRVERPEGVAGDRDSADSDFWADLLVDNFPPRDLRQEIYY